eukprot:gnl/MRDRNA2_/MRDRNA2_351564_c0_seq1.p1 gnl/MRDRNA2_/MRDRNA2_351564_c0~~gnl/MRDRNA2_/MRDRNA2_351564_c0_seq1.p1  ORF type:complete len:159 (+),score=21.39 gnl/MRDRNA2_/MRDRNA2_351564_c0_seq1:64-540(+)
MATRTISLNTHAKVIAKIQEVLEFEVAGDKYVTDLVAQCIICGQTFKNGDRLKQWNSCQHKFHRDCLHRMLWLSGHATNEKMGCPMCNRDARIHTKISDDLKRPARPHMHGYSAPSPSVATNESAEKKKGSRADAKLAAIRDILVEKPINSGVNDVSK